MQICVAAQGIGARSMVCGTWMLEDDPNKYRLGLESLNHFAWEGDLESGVVV
jgi:hypothetical protein